MMVRRIGQVAFVGASLLAVTAVAQNDGAPSNKPSWRVPAGDMKRGEAIALTCLSCHGENPTVKVDTTPPKLYRQRASAIFAALLDYKSGVRKNEYMTRFAQGLSEQDMRDVAVYFQQDFPDTPPEVDVTFPGYEKTIYACGTCHGEGGIGELEGMQVLTGQDPAYIESAFAEYQNGSRTEPTMAAIAKGYTPQQAAVFARYYGSAFNWLERAK